MMDVHTHTFTVTVNDEDPEIGGYFAYQAGDEELGWQAWRGWGTSPYDAIHTLMEVLMELEKEGAGDTYG